MFKFLTGSAMPYVAGVVAALFCALGLTCYIEHVQLSASKAQLALAQQNLKSTVTDNSQDQSAITTLQNDLARWRDSAENAAHAHAAVEAELVTVKAQLATASAAATQTESKDNGNLTCSRILATDLLAACPSHIVAQRVRAASSLQRSFSN